MVHVDRHFSSVGTLGKISILMCSMLKGKEWCMLKEQNYLSLGKDLQNDIKQQESSH